MNFFKGFSLFIPLLFAQRVYCMEAEVTAQQHILITLIEQKTREIDKEYEELTYDPKYKEQRIQRVKDFYPLYEKNLTDFRYLFQNYEMAGSINYFMSVKEIIEVVKAKFKNMYRKGQIITKQQFAEKDQSKWFRRARTDLTRIWGAEYLARKFKENNKTGYKVPEYSIVVDDLKKIQVILYMGNLCFPFISEIGNGEIIAEKIEGTEIAVKGQDLIGFGYTDYSAPGNVIMNKEGIIYPVDTEYNSFYTGRPEQYLFEEHKQKTGNSKMMCEFFYSRFKLCNPQVKPETVIEFSLFDA